MEDIQQNRIIIAFFSGTASEEECMTLQKWIKKAPENQSYFQELYNIWQTTCPAFDPHGISVKKAEKKLLRKIRKKKKISTGIWIYWQRIAAVIIIPLFLLTAYLVIKQSGMYDQNVYQKLTVPYGMVSEVNLPDGSNVWLNGGSSLKYPIHFTKGKRQVELTGEGYFEVESDPGNPFLVETASAEIMATGTAFNINACENDSIVAVTLSKGIVNIAFGNSRSVSLKPGDHIRLNRNTLRCTLRQTDPYKWYAWKDGLMIFRDDPLSYVFKRLEQTFNIEIVIKEPDILEALYHATFEGESLNEILRLLEKSAPIHFIHLDRTSTEDNEFEKQRIMVYRK